MPSISPKAPIARNTSDITPTKKREVPKMVTSLFHEYPQGESNSYLRFRKPLFYPLNYEGIQRHAQAAHLSGKDSKNFPHLVCFHKYFPVNMGFEVSQKIKLVKIL